MTASSERRLDDPAHIEVRRAAVVVVGAGVAGLTAALAIAEGGAPGSEVIVLADRLPGEGGSSPWAQGGMAAAVGRDDRSGDHAADTVAAGAGLVDPQVARLVTADGPDSVAWLERVGAAFDRTADGAWALGREAAHRVNRIVHAKDATGAELVRALRDAAAGAPGVRVVAGHVAIDMVRGNGEVIGVLSRTDNAEGLVAWVASAVVLATGGYAHLWAVTTTPPQAVGDGVAMAARAGAAFADMEFVQFHPTAVAVDPPSDSAGPPSGQVPLLTEALRGEGAVLVDETGRRFCDELAPRDVVARAIYDHRTAGHRTLLDARPLGARLAVRFPTVLAACTRLGLDPRREPIPVSPAAHYCMGGVVTDLTGRTTLPGLWAAGEVTATGLHGANRLASNSLLEAVVMGRQVGSDVRRHLAEHGGPVYRDRVVSVPQDAPTLVEHDPAGVVVRVRRLLWERAGVTRDGAGLEAARTALDGLAREAAATRSRPARNAVLVAQLVVDAALARRESRGAHQRVDFPAPAADPPARRTVTSRAATLVELVVDQAVAA